MSDCSGFLLLCLSWSHQPPDPNTLLPPSLLFPPLLLTHLSRLCLSYTFHPHHSPSRARTLSPPPTHSPPLPPVQDAIDRPPTRVHRPGGTGTAAPAHLHRRTRRRRTAHPHMGGSTAVHVADRDRGRPGLDVHHLPHLPESPCLHRRMVRANTPAFNCFVANWGCNRNVDVPANTFVQFVVTDSTGSTGSDFVLVNPAADDTGVSLSPPCSSAIY